MNKKSVISVVNNQIVYGEQDKIKFMIVGTYGKKDGKYYIRYKDYKESETNKDRGTCLIKVERPDLVTITRIGEVKSWLMLEKGKKHYSQYKNEYGMLSMGIYAQNVECELGESTAKIHLKYFMDINLDLVSDNEVYIDVKGFGEENVEHVDNGN